MSSLISDVYALAQRAIQNAKLFRAQRIAELECIVQQPRRAARMMQHSHSAQGRPAREWRRHVSALARMRAMTGNSAVIAVPRFEDMSSAAWRHAGGVSLTRALADTYGLTREGLFERMFFANLQHNLYLAYGKPSVAGSSVAHRGNLIIAGDIWPSITVRTSGSHAGRLHSLLMLDVDVPFEADQRRIPLILWAKLNQPSVNGGPLHYKAENGGQAVYDRTKSVSLSKINKPSLRDAGSRDNLEVHLEAGHIQLPETAADSSSNCLDYIPPHPARGSDTHRIVALMLEHQRPLLLSEVADHALGANLVCKGAPGLYSERVTTADRISSLNGVSVCGLQFHRTCWTLPVSDIFAHLGIPEPVYGVLEGTPNV